MSARAKTKPAKPKKATKAPNEPVKDAAHANGTVTDQAETNGSTTHQGKGGAPTVVEPQPPTDRNELGQFVKGHNGGPGRPPGSKNKLIEDFIADFHAAWQESG